MSSPLHLPVEPPAPVALSAIARRLRAATLLVRDADRDRGVTGVAADSRLVRAGDLYCAWRGTTADAHDYLGAAAAAGAAAAIVERPVSEVSLPQLVVRDGRRAAALGAAVVYGDPQSALRTVGVTGTNGKTTTVWILRHLLSAFHATASLGTLGLILENGEPLPGSEALTTPGPVELARTLRYLVQRGVQAIALEVSSHALAQGRVHALDFDVAVFTNLSRDHLDYHGTLEAYLEAKLLLGGMLRPAGAAVVNADDPAWSRLDPKDRRTLRFSERSADADVRAEHVQLGPFGARFDCVFGRERAHVSLPLLGGFNVQNGLAAVAALLALGHPLESVAARLGTVPQVPGRLERIASGPCTVLRDYAHTPDALERALQTLRPLTPGRLVVVFGAGGDRDRGKRPLMGEAAQRHADVAIVTSDNPRTEDPVAIIDEIAAGMSGEHIRIVDRREAIAHALASASPDDVVLLAGKGHEDYQIVGHEKRPFDERVIVRDLLRAHRGDA